VTFKKAIKSIEISSLVINKLTLDQYKTAKSEGNVVENEVYVINDIDDVVYTKAEVDAAITAIPIPDAEDLGLSEALLLKNKTSKMPKSASWYGSCYGGGKFVASALGSDKMAYSLDGITWHESNSLLQGGWRSVVYGNGKFVMLE
jgi:hypothetical protein